MRGKSFSSIAMIYEDDDIVSPVVRKIFYKNNFYEARFNKEDIRSKFLQIDWPYIYSLNIDDLIENSSRYKTVILPNRKFYSEICNDEKCVFKLHGDISEIIKYKDSFKVFTSKEYVESVLANRSILSKLQSDYASVNLLFFGCSLKDEMDLLSIDKLDLISNHNNAEGYTIKKNIFFTVGKPSLLEESRYKQYGITDVAVFDDYNARLSGTYAYKQQKISYDFTQASGKIEFCIGGHIHNNFLTYSDNGIPVVSVISDYAVSPKRGTDKEQSVTLVVADYKNEKLNLFVVGRGSDRSIEL